MATPERRSDHRLAVEQQALLGKCPLNPLQVRVPRHLSHQLAFATFPFADVMRDRRHPDQPAAGVVKRRDGEPDVDEASVAAAVLGLVVVDALAAEHAGSDLGFPEQRLLGKDQRRDRLADRLSARVAVEVLRGAVPRDHRAVGRGGDDRVL